MINTKRIEEIVNEARKEFKSRVLPTVMVIGASGSGKSTLVNTVFGKEIAHVGVGEAQTKGFTRYDGNKLGLNFNLIDAEGWELGEDENIQLNKISEYLDGVKKSGESIQVIWYCISIDARRIQNMDICILDLLMKRKEISKNVFVVFTKANMDSPSHPNTSDEYLKIIGDHFPQLKCFRVCDDQALNRQHFDMSDMIRCSSERIDDEELADIFVAAQSYELSLKREKANKFAKTSAFQAAVAGATPIPIADSIIIVGIQIRMITKIGLIYGFNLMESVAANGGEAIISQIGKLLAKNLGERAIAELTKLIPGIGTLVGSAANAVVAASITYSLGRAVSEYYYSLYKKLLTGQQASGGDIIKWLSNEDFLKGIESRIEDYQRMTEEN